MFIFLNVVDSPVIVIPGVGCGTSPGGIGVKCPVKESSWAILLACSKAVANACTLEKRCCGSFASALNTTSSTRDEMPEILPYRDGGGVSTCWLAISVKDPLNGRCPLSHS